MAAASTTKQVLRRAQLYVPGSSMRFLEKSRSIPSIDSIAYDLEDSVTPALKPQARLNILSILNRPRAPGIREQAVRINSIDSGHALQDLLTLLPAAKHLDCLVIPKVNSPSDLAFVIDMLKHLLPDRHDPSNQETYNPVKLVALIESARAVMDLREICSQAPSTREFLSGLTFAAEDFAKDLNLTRTPDLTEFLYARSAIVTAARAFEIPSTLDLVCTAVSTTSSSSSSSSSSSTTSPSTSPPDNPEEDLTPQTLQTECLNGKRLGFSGKQCIHPSQIAPVQEVFSPSAAEVEWAVRVVVGDERAAAQGQGAWVLEGKMIDAPVSGKARATVARAEACGFDVRGLREKYS